MSGVSRSIGRSLTGGLLVALTASAAFAGATVTGTVTYEGKVPNLKPLAMDADPACAAKHTSPVANEMLVLGSGNTMGNIIVSVKSGLPTGKTYPAPKEAFVMDQSGCQYKPHVFALQVGQPLKVLNSDGVLHNVHALPKVNGQFNMAMPATRKEAEHTFDKVELTPFQVKCDVHPWMTAHVSIFDHPYFAVTKDDGKFTIADLPAGTYEIEAWHEKLGSKTEKVTVADGESKTIAFKFTAPGGN
ncbi:MAG: carboxypeptidase regulatory-like domain-containing protein [Deltaproteobacteria bacterium]|nr:carboxypeptidase regulatory-like domain-containing protein [Deltaproteobacteria bacterium]